MSQIQIQIQWQIQTQMPWLTVTPRKLDQVNNAKSGTNNTCLSVRWTQHCSVYLYLHCHGVPAYIIINRLDRWGTKWLAGPKWLVASTNEFLPLGLFHHSLLVIACQTRIRCVNYRGITDRLTAKSPSDGRSIRPWITNQFRDNQLTVENASTWVQPWNRQDTKNMREEGRWNWNCTSSSICLNILAAKSGFAWFFLAQTIFDPMNYWANKF